MGKSRKDKEEKYVAQLDLDEERRESDENNQFKVVSHNPLSDLENVCENIKSNENLSVLKSIDFDKLGGE